MKNFKLHSRRFSQNVYILNSFKENYLILRKIVWNVHSWNLQFNAFQQWSFENFFFIIIIIFFILCPNEKNRISLYIYLFIFSKIFTHKNMIIKYKLINLTKNAFNFELLSLQWCCNSWTCSCHHKPPVVFFFLFFPFSSSSPSSTKATWSSSSWWWWLWL